MKNGETQVKNDETPIRNGETSVKNDETSVENGETPPKEEAPYKDLVSLDPSLDKGGMFLESIGNHDWYS